MEQPHDNVKRRIAIVGRLGVYPMMRLSLPGRRLLAYLALHRQPAVRGLASAQLWPSVPDDVGRANLRRALWHVPRGWVTTIGDELMLNAECDLEEAHRSAARALAGEPLSLDEIELLSNDILPGWYEEWVLPEQDAFHMLRTHALEAACRTMALSGLYGLAVQAGTAAVAAEPLRESAAEALIDAHLAQRNRYQAMQCYQMLSQRLAHALGVEPDPALAARVVGINHTKRRSS
ncbi:AfsR/SARP family transcriptional regulator [Cupriavidus necator]|uniref:AfsR/SARP family transcriptional regulator n=1 Tax=Cupriavidus necator TaxID=106590 RepID=UPI0005B3F924|nr:BTAD domain-containing putative transcriptional regulator [Cupriavidus necator]